MAAINAAQRAGIHENSSGGVAYAGRHGNRACYFAMDRDKNYRVAKAYAAVAAGEGATVADACAAIQAAYDRGTRQDEFVKPSVVGDYGGIRDGDGHGGQFPGRPDPRDPDGAARPRFLGNARPGATTAAALRHDVLFGGIYYPDGTVGAKSKTCWAAMLSGEFASLRIAETEKYAHVTFFFNGGEERTFEGEDRILILRRRSRRTICNRKCPHPN